MAEKLTLASMCAGGVQERIDRALAKISDNILDLNTDAKKKRVLDVKITLTPNEDDREDVSVEVQTSVKLVPEMGLKTQLFINKDFRSGVTTLTEHSKGAIKGQLTLDDCGMSMNPEEDEEERPVTAEELGCDPETGEVLEKETPKEGPKVISIRGSESNQYERCSKRLGGTAMNFGKAIEEMKAGKKVARQGWNGKGQYIELASNISYVNADGNIVNCEHDAIGNKAIAFVGTSGVQMGWLASQADMLAEDWQIVQ